MKGLGLLVVLAVMIRAAPSASEPMSADSSVAGLTSLVLPDSTAGIDSITVVLTSGARNRYTRVESWPGGYVRAFRQDGSMDYLPAHRIESIRTATSDLTKRVLDRGASFGAMPSRASVEGAPALRGRPLPRKKSFPLIQMGLLAPLGGDFAHSTTFVMDLGVMKNRTPRRSWGGSFGVAVNDEYVRLNLKPRLRLWLGDTPSIDLAAGAFYVVGEDQGTYGPFGFVGETSFVVGDWVSLTGLVEVTEVESVPAGFTSSASHASRMEPMFHLGAKAGGEVSVVAGAVMLVLLVGYASAF